MDDFGIVLKDKGKQAGSRADQAWGGEQKKPLSGGTTVQVRLSGPVKDAVDRYAASDTDCELGGVLLGSYTEKNGIYRVRVDAAVKALHTEAARSNIKFTHRTWDNIERVRNDRFSHLKVVGWFHTHPGFGVFMSGHDQFIHQNFFDLPFQVAYVVDPVGQEGGFFGWKGNKISRVPCRVERRVKTLPRPINPDRPEKKTKKRPLPIALGLAAVLLVAALVLNVVQYERVEELRGETMVLREEREELVTEVSKLNSIVTEHEEALARSREINERAMYRITELRAIVTQQRFPGPAENSGDANNDQGVSGQ